MRKTCFVIAAVLLGGGPLAAQQKAAPAQPATWAVAYTAGSPKTAGASGTTYVLLPTAAPPGNAAGLVLAVPVAAQPAPQPAPPPPACANGHCAGGHCAEHQTCDWEHVRAWLCYRSLQGGCPKKGGSCGCNCSVPLYVYFLHECKEGRKFEPPPCAHVKEPPHLFHAMIGDARAMFRSCGSGTPASPCPVRTEPAVSYGAAQQAAAHK
jgi:hypothetical protein